jgi:ubiquitin-protein ligase
VDPRVREEALVRVRNQVVQYANGHPGFDVSANSSQAPTEYLLQFRARSFAPPGSPKGEPLKIDSHEVFLALPADFPMVAPEAFWQTPIFHPNVHATAGKVCLGLLGENFRPGMDFGELCQLLVEIAAYRNYAITEGYNADAQEWAFSDKGQQAIAEIGGRPVVEMLAEELLDWPRERFMKLPSEVQKQLEALRNARSQPTRPFRIKKV